MKTIIVKILGLYLNTLAYLAPRKAGRDGFLLFCRPVRLKISQKQKEFFNSADRFNIQFDDLTIQGYRWGNGKKKIVFLHGWQSHTYRWKAYIDALPKDSYTIYALDAPGHGSSQGSFLSVPVYSTLIHQFLTSLGEVHAVVGHSLGSFSILYTFYRYPLLSVRKVVLMAPPGEATDFMNFYSATLRLTGRTMRYIIDHFVSTYQVGPNYFSTAKFATALNVNGLIIHDVDDNEAPYKYAQVIHQTWKQSQLVTTKGFGHNLKSPSVVNKVVDFIEDTEQPSLRHGHEQTVESLL